MAENVLFNQNQTTPVQPVMAAKAAGKPVPPTSHSQIGTWIKIILGLLVFLLLVGGAIFFLRSVLNSSNKTKVTLTYWGIWEDKKTMQPIIDAFEKQNPTISINYEVQDLKQLSSEKQPYPTRLIARINSGEGPDIFRFHNTWYPMLSSVLAPFPSSVISTKQYSTTFFPVVSDDLIHNGAIYGVPLGFDTLALFINPEIFQGTAVPTDWNDFYTTAQSLTVKGTDGTITTAGAAMGIMSNVTHAEDIVALLLADSNVYASTIGVNSDNAGKALLYYTNFANSTGAVWDSTLPSSLQMFAKGNLAMYVGYSWDIFSIQALNPSLKFEIHPMPALYGTQRTLASYWVEGVSIRSRHPQEAMLFMKYLLQKDTNQLFYSSAAKERGFGEPYARADLANTLKGNTLIYPFVEQGANAVSSVFSADTYDSGINAISNQYLDNAIAQVASSGTADSAVTTLGGGMKKVLAQYGAD
ncbi:MAG TPA: extracellular solute-binding protein [Patescibacteria group bacterium]|nr:extracellular solute-binding protein [Patescibacteria group bacterium]